jgi:hypothetical protein
MAPLEDWAEDRIFTGVEIHLDWMDRLRVLCGRPLHVDVKVSCEHAPGRTAGSSRIWIERFIFPWTHTGGYAESPSLEKTS